jgi:NADPH2:quinone reductase
MPRAIRIRETGGPEVLRLETVEREPLGARQVRIRQTAIGVNFIDTYDRSGLYPVSLPSGLGREAAGVVTEAGKGVAALKPGDRVAYAGNTPGAYCDERVMDAARVVKLPDSVSDREAAAMMLKGLTAWFLLRRCHRLRRNEPV